MDKKLKENLQKALVKATISQAPWWLWFLMTFLDSFTDEYDEMFQQNNLLELNNELLKKYSNMDILINDIQKLIKNPDSIYILKKVINISNKNRKVDWYMNLLSNILFNTLKNLDIIDFYEEKWYIIDLIENISSDALVLFYEINKYFWVNLRNNNWTYWINFDNDKFIWDIKFYWKLKSVDWRFLIWNYILDKYNNDLIKIKSINLHYLVVLLDELLDKWLITWSHTNNVIEQIRVWYIWTKVLELIKD